MAKSYARPGQGQKRSANATAEFLGSADEDIGPETPGPQRDEAVQAAGEPLPWEQLPPGVDFGIKQLPIRVTVPLRMKLDWLKAHGGLPSLMGYISDLVEQDVEARVEEALVRQGIPREEARERAVLHRKRKV